MRCPCCGFDILSYQDFPFSVPGPSSSQPPTVPFSEAFKFTPSRAPAIEGDVFVPLCQSLITGILVGLPSGFVVSYLGGSWSLAASSVFLVTSCSWVLLLVDHRKLLRTVERVVGLDLDGDRLVGDQPSVPQTVRVEVHQGQGRWVFADLPGNEAALLELARGLSAGRSLSEDEWTGSGRPYSRSEFKQLRSELVDRGLAYWRNPKARAQGIDLTVSGKAVFRRIAGLPLPSDNGSGENG